MKTKKVILALLAVALGTASLHAQQAETLNLSLADAQQYAVEHNYSLQNATLDVKKAEAAKWQTLSSMLPQVKASFDYSNMCGYEMNLGQMSIPMNPSGSFGITASVALTAQQIMGTLMQDVALKMSDISRQQSELDTRASVKSVYTSILVMEDIVTLLDSTLANMQQLEATTRASVQAGAAEQIQADKLAVQVASMRNTIKSNRRSLVMLKNSLLLQLGANPNTQLNLTSTLDQILNIDQVTQLTMGGFKKEDNYTYQILQQNEKLAQHQVTNAWLAFTPTLSAYYQYSNKTYFGKAEGMNMTPPNMIGASISLPLFTSASRLAAINEAKISLQETLNNKQQSEDALEVQYNQYCYDMITAIESYQIQKENLQVTKRVFENTSEKYKYGSASNLEVTNASTDLITAESNYIQAVTSVVSAQVNLEKLLCNAQ